MSSLAFNAKAELREFDLWSPIMQLCDCLFYGHASTAIDLAGTSRIAPENSGSSCLAFLSHVYNGQLETATIQSKIGGPCIVRCRDKTVKFDTDPGNTYDLMERGEK